MTNHPNRNWRNRWANDPAAYVMAFKETHGLSWEDFGALLNNTPARTVQDWGLGNRTPPNILPLALHYVERGLMKKGGM